jgi:hypothetical protein
VKRRGNHIRAVFGLELDISYPFPSAEGLSIILGLIIFLTIMFQSVYYPFMITESPFVNNLELERVSEFIAAPAFYILSGPYFDMMILFPILLPLLCAFRVAGPFENGVLKSVLTHPIRRSGLLVVKGLQILLLTCLPVTLGSFVGITLFNGLLLGLESALAIASFWTLGFMILSLSFLVSVATRSSAKAAFGGVGLSTALFVIATLSKLPATIRGVANPLNLTVSYFQGFAPFGNSIDGLVFGDVIVSVLGSLTVGVLAFLLSIKLFKEAEI